MIFKNFAFFIYFLGCVLICRFVCIYSFNLYIYLFQYPTIDLDLQQETRVNLPDFDLSLQCKDLLLRLLEIEPSKRLRSLRTLQTISFFHKFDFEEIKERKVCSDLIRNFIFLIFVLLGYTKQLFSNGTSSIF